MATPIQGTGRKLWFLLATHRNPADGFITLLYLLPGRNGITWNLYTPLGLGVLKGTRFSWWLDHWAIETIDIRRTETQTGHYQYTALG